MRNPVQQQYGGFYRTGLTLLLFVTIHVLPAQMFRVDSLRAVLATEGRTTARVDHLIALAFAISDAEFTTESAGIVALLDEANVLATELKYAEGLAYAPMGPAFQAFDDGRYSDALDGFKACIALLDLQHIEQGMASPLADIRRVYTAAGLQEERLAFYQDALLRYRRTGPALNAAICEHGLGGYYLSLRQYGQAIEHYMKAREGLQAVGANVNDVANETGVIGQCYILWGNMEQAEPYLREAIDIFLREKNIDQAMSAAIDLCDMAFLRSDTADALDILRSIRPNWNVMSPLREGMTRVRMVMAHLAFDQVDSAHTQLLALNALADSSELPLFTTAGECEVDYTNYLFQKALGQHDVADAHLKKALVEALRVQYLVLVLKYRKELAARYLRRGDAYNAALQSMAYINLNDSLQARTNTSSIAAYEGQVKERENERAMQVQESRLRQQRIISFSIAGGLMLLVVLAIVVYRGKKRSDALLLNILPAEVANELKAKGHADARHFDQATILFTDFKGFTEASEKLTPQELVEELNTCFKAFDHIITARGIEKIKTIGDAYMCAGGLPDPKTSAPADVVHAALEMQAFMIARKKERDAAALPAFEMRVGIHTGPVVAGIVGVKKFQYDIWGDTVNTASRMESSGEVGQVNISEATYALVKDAVIAEDGVTSTHRVDPTSDSEGHGRPGNPAFTFTPRGKVQAKGKGELEMYFVSTFGGAGRP